MCTFMGITLKYTKICIMSVFLKVFKWEKFKDKALPHMSAQEDMLRSNYSPGHGWSQVLYLPKHTWALNDSWI